jgi:hypothetical protein
MAWRLPLVGTLRSLLGRRRSRFSDTLHVRLGVRELERRRVLDASFTLGSTSLTLSGFTPDSIGLTIAQSGGLYQFTLNEGTWSQNGGALGDITGEGTSKIDVPITAVESLPDGIAVNADPSTHDIDVVLQSADFSTLLGPVTIAASGDITDTLNANIQFGQEANFQAIGNITLAVSPANTFTVDGNATFVTVADGDVAVGVAGATALTESGATVRMGTLSFNTGFGQVRILEDADPNPPTGSFFTMTVSRREDANQGGSVELGTSEGGIELDSLVARNLLVESAGPIHDYRDDAQIIVDDGLGGGDGWFQADGPISLGDKADNQFRVVGRATFVTFGDEDVDVGVAATKDDFTDSGANVRMGTLSFNTGFGPVRIVEDGEAAAGGQFTMTVARRNFDRIGGEEANQGGDVKLRTTGGGIQLDSVLARDLFVDSAGAMIDYRDDAQIIVDNGLGGGDGWFQADGPLTLADKAPNQLRVVGRATFVAFGDETIDIGASPATDDLTDSGGNVRMGTVSFNAGFGPVRIVEDGDAAASDQFTMTVVRRDFDRAGGDEPNQGGHVQLRTTGGGMQLDSLLARELRALSAGAIVDHRSDVQIIVDDGLGGGDAWFQAARSITLAQDKGDTLRVNQWAVFIAGDRDGTLENIDVGPPGNVNFGQLDLTGQVVAVQEDSSTELTGVFAHELTLDSTGNITDVPSAPITIHQFASLGAGIDIVLGDELANFQFPGLQLFDPDRYLAIGARHASLQLSTSVNLLTDVSENPDRSVVTRGTLFLAAAGSIAQVGGGGIQADAAAFRSDGAIVLTGIDLGESNQFGSSHHFAASAEGALDLGTMVPSDVIPEKLPRTAGDLLAPVEVMPITGGGTVLGKRAAGDSYALVVTGYGDLTIGQVSDPTMTQNVLTGIAVGQGNGFVETLATNGTGEGTGASNAEPGDLFFTARGAASPVVVRSGSQVFTAVAAGQLVIDGPNVGEGGAFTMLMSDTGVVTSVGPFNSFDGRFPDQPTVPKVGPRMILTPPSIGPLAATTAEVTSPNFIQNIEIAFGSMGESHFIFEIVWADVRNRPGDAPLPDSVQGTVDNPEVVDLPSGADTRTFTHQFSPAFLATNPAIPNLPTFIRMFNDPAINLFASVGNVDLNQSTTQLGLDPEVTGNFVSPRFVAGVVHVDPRPNFRSQAQPIEPAPIAVPPGTDHTARAGDADAPIGEIRPLDSEQQEVIRYGPVKLDEHGKWVWEVGWPKVWTGERTGDWVEQIRRELARGAWDLGQRFQIRVWTGGGEQIVEGWEFKPPDVDVTPATIEQQSRQFESQHAPQLATDQNATEPNNAGDNKPGHAVQLGALGAALAIVPAATKPGGQRVSPTQLAQLMEKWNYRGFSLSERRHRLVQQLCNENKR